MKLFIAGGTGFVGEHLVSKLRHNQHQIRLLIHRRKKSLDTGIEFYDGDVTNPDDVMDAVAGCDAIINLVGIIREFPNKGITFDRLHVQATSNLVEAAKKNGIERFLQMSALGTRPNAVSRYHQTKFQAENFLKDSSLKWTIFRPSLIYGLHDSFVTMLAKQLKLSPIIPIIGDGKYRMQPVHADDVASCFAGALNLPESIGKIYELCGNDRMSYCKLLDAISNALGKKAPLKLPLPLSLMQGIIPLLQTLPQFPITSDQLQMLLEESICDDCSWQKLFAVEQRSFYDAIAEYVK